MIEENIKSEVVGVDISIESTTYAIVDVRGNILAETPGRRGRRYGKSFGYVRANLRYL